MPGITPPTAYTWQAPWVAVVRAEEVADGLLDPRGPLGTQRRGPGKPAADLHQSQPPHEILAGAVSGRLRLPPRTVGDFQGRSVAAECPALDRLLQGQAAQNGLRTYGPGVQALRGPGNCSPLARAGSMKSIISLTAASNSGCAAAYRL